MTTVEDSVATLPFRPAAARAVPHEEAMVLEARPDVTPLGDRIVALQLVRVAMGLAVLGVAAFAGKAMELTFDQALYAVVPYAFGVALAELARLRRWPWAAGAMHALLLVDAVFIACAIGPTGKPGGTLSVLYYLDLIAVTLLLSWRTGLRLALWMSIVQIVVFQVLDVYKGGLSPTDASLQVVSFLVVSVCVAALSSLNERELRIGRDEMRNLAAMAAELEQIGSPAEAREVLARHVRDDLGFRRAVVAGPECRDHLVELSERSREPVLRKVIDPVTDPELDALLPGARNVAVIALTADGTSMGTLVIECGGRPGATVANRTLASARQFANHAAMAIGNAALLAEVERLANTDALTGIANRRVFEEMLARELLLASRNEQPLSLVVIDVDFFKKVNDVHGHQAGDDVLRHVGRSLSSAGRVTDVPARFGGEEFVVVLPACPPGEALVVAERYRAAIAGPGGPVPVTASAGVATFPLNAGDGSTLLAAADAALYQSKAAGRNRTTVSRRRPRVAGRRTPLAAVRSA